MCAVLNGERCRLCCFGLNRHVQLKIMQQLQKLLRQLVFHFMPAFQCQIICTVLRLVQAQQVVDTARSSLKRV